MKWFDKLLELTPSTDIQSQRLGAMNKHWSNIDGGDSLISIGLVALGLIVFFLIMNAVLSAIQQRSKKRTQALHRKNRNIR